MTYLQGYHYDLPKRGNGWRLESDALFIYEGTKASLMLVRRELIASGTNKNDISITKNDND